jgi:hypothetical protein
VWGQGATNKAQSLLPFKFLVKESVSTEAYNFLAAIENSLLCKQGVQVFPLWGGRGGRVMLDFFVVLMSSQYVLITFS